MPTECVLFPLASYLFLSETPPEKGAPPLGQSPSYLAFLLLLGLPSFFSNQDPVKMRTHHGPHLSTVTIQNPFSLRIKSDVPLEMYAVLPE